MLLRAGNQITRERIFYCPVLITEVLPGVLPPHPVATLNTDRRNNRLCYAMRFSITIQRVGEFQVTVVSCL